jgi:RecB family exonuclease
MRFIETDVANTRDAVARIEARLDRLLKLVLKIDKDLQEHKRSCEGCETEDHTPDKHTCPAWVEE